MSKMSRGEQIPGLEVLNGESVDISKCKDFEFYDLIWLWDNQEEIEKPCIGRWLGVSHWFGSELYYWILTDKGTVLYRTSVQYVTIDKKKGTNIADKVKDYTYTLDGNLSDMKYIYTEYDF